MIEIIENARTKIRDAMKQQERGLLYVAIDNLLPPDYDREDLVQYFKLQKYDDRRNRALFESLFEKDGAFLEKNLFSYKKEIEKAIIIAAIAFIGLHFSQKKDKLDSVKKEDYLDSCFHTMLPSSSDKNVYLNFYKFIQGDFKFHLEKDSPQNLFDIILDEYDIKFVCDKIPTVKRIKEMISFHRHDKEKVFYIASVIIGMAIVLGKISNYKKVNKSNFVSYEVKSEQKERKLEKTEKGETFKPVSRGVIILILPANKIADINEGQKINTETTIRLIDDSVYFGCFPENKGNEIEKEFDLKEDNILSDTAQDIYVRLDVEKGTDLIEKFSKFSLKKCLQNKPREFTISKIRLLDKLHGLEKLNRI